MNAFAYRTEDGNLFVSPRAMISDGLVVPGYFILWDHRRFLTIVLIYPPLVTLLFWLLERKIPYGDVVFGLISALSYSMSPAVALTFSKVCRMDVTEMEVEVEYNFLFFLYIISGMLTISLNVFF